MTLAWSKRTEVHVVVPLSLQDVRGRVRDNADRYQYSLLSPTRAAGARDFIYEERDTEFAVSLRSWWPDWYGLEAAIRIEPLRLQATGLRVRFQVPRSSRIVASCFLALFVGLPLIALAAPSGVDRPGTLVLLAGSITFLVVVPLAYRWLRRNKERLFEFLEMALPEAEWRPDPHVRRHS